MFEFGAVKISRPRYLRGRVHSKLQLGFLAVVYGEALHEEGGEPGTGSAAEWVEDQESLHGEEQDKEGVVKF